MKNRISYSTDVIYFRQWFHLHKGILVSVLALVILVSTNPVVAQDTENPVIRVDFIELTLVPEDFSELNQGFPLFSSESTLASILNMNSTMFWEPIGNYGMNLTENALINTIAVVQINSTGFYQTLVGLSIDNQSLEWIHQLDSSVSENFSVVVKSATDFFSDDGRYWGLCEEIIVIPGALGSQTENIVWRLKFHLVAESERWALFLDSSGEVIDFQFATVPCQPCIDYTPYVVVGIITVTVTVFALIIFIRQRR
jgi:hypothetical protein